MPAFIGDLADSATGLLIANNSGVVDKYGAAVNGTILEDSTK